MTNRSLNNGTLPNVDFMEIQTQGIVTGNRIPKEYFETKGTGESDITVHAGSYHLALKAASIERYNIMTYSSILPSIATRIGKPKALTLGAVMESIMSVYTAEKGEQATAGIIYGWLYNKRTNTKFGGLVCEHYGSYGLTELNHLLNASLEELYVNGFSNEYNLREITYLTESFTPKKKYGTALVALCFTSYYYPVLQTQ
ncbi:MAG: arginine decarboxylase [Bacteroidales bacterium]|nr:arginine decarboxylase [Bacteroidales bacterium]MBN2750241.1 arginine decarboxylase [Bacteroidales bacterium]